MHQFLKKCLLFFASSIFLFAIVFCFFSWKNKSHLTQYKLKQNSIGVLIGDSHVQNALNDAMFKEVKNVAHFAESYFLSYYKIDLLLDANPQIQKVYLGYSYHNLSNYYDDYISGKYANAISSEYFFMLPVFEQGQCMFWNLGSLPAYMKDSFDYGYKNIVSTNNLSFMGGYENGYINTMATKPAMDKRIKAQYYKDGTVREFSSINLDYLNRIINLCKFKRVELCLINTPIQSYYAENVPEVYIHKYHEIISNNHLEVIDFSNLALKADCFMVDGDHVSKKGAQKTTEYFLNYFNSKKH